VQPPVVILVGPSHPGNVGASARGAANFGCTDFRVVSPRCDIVCKEALDRAKHAKGLLTEAKVYPDLKSALAGVSLAVGTTARTQPSGNHFLRKPSDIRDFLGGLGAMEGRVAWVFGREDSGLTGAEVDILDAVVTIPTAEYWSLNLSHAVTLCCYEHHRLERASITPERSLSPGALTALHNAFDALVEETEPREWRRRTARGVWRKIVGRSYPDTFEVHNVMGILSNALKRFGHEGYATEKSQEHLASKGLLVGGDEMRQEDAEPGPALGEGLETGEPEPPKGEPRGATRAPHESGP
jgi:TrmH family RNA methyltransferase